MRVCPPDTPRTSGAPQVHPRSQVQSKGAPIFCILHLSPKDRVASFFGLKHVAEEAMAGLPEVLGAWTGRVAMQKGRGAASAPGQEGREAEPGLGAQGHTAATPSPWQGRPALCPSQQRPWLNPEAPQHSGRSEPVPPGRITPLPLDVGPIGCIHLFRTCWGSSARPSRTLPPQSRLHLSPQSPAPQPLTAASGRRLRSEEAACPHGHAAR